MSNNPLWLQVFAAFKEHKIAQTPQANLNRIAAKCILRQTFEPTNCHIHEEVLSPRDLQHLVLYSTDDDCPHRVVEPIIVLAYGGHV